MKHVLHTKSPKKEGKMLSEIFTAEGFNISLNVLNIGANPYSQQAVDGKIDKILTSYPDSIVTCFDIDESACENLNRISNRNVCYYPCALGFGREKRTLYQTKHPMCSSLYEPNDAFNTMFQGLGVARLERVDEIDTMPLDEFAAIHNAGPFDFLKIDVQGAELEVFMGGEKALQNIVAIATEVEFVPLYKEQPLFGDISRYLYKRRFLFHKFLNLQGRSFKPLLYRNNPYFPSSHLWADAVFVKNYEEMEKLSSEQILKMAALLDIYQSQDLACLLLQHFDRNENANLSEQYIHYLESQQNGWTRDPEAKRLYRKVDRSSAKTTEEPDKNRFACEKPISLGDVLRNKARQSATSVLHQGNNPPGKVSIDEAILEAERIYASGEMQKASSKIHNAVERVIAGDVPQTVSLDFQSRWKTCNLVGVLFKLWMRVNIFSTFLSRKKAIKLLKIWVSEEKSSFEANYTYGLCCALIDVVRHQTIRPATRSILERARQISDDPRIRTILDTVDEQRSSEVKVPYDNGSIHVYPDLRNISTYTLLEQGDWFEEDMILFRRLVRPGYKVLDVGANIGVYATSAARRVGENGFVCAIEPCAGTFRFLKKNVGVFPNVKCIHAAVSDKPGVGFLQKGNDPEYNQVVSGGNQERGEKVVLTTIDQAAIMNGVERFDIIKIDVEGHEESALEGAVRTIHKHAPVIFYEIKEIANINLRMIKLFRKLGYESYYYNALEDCLVHYRDGDKLNPKTLNMVAIKPEKIHLVGESVKIIQNGQGVKTPTFVHHVETQNVANY
jgi:FkbM family methyltransferase